MRKHHLKQSKHSRMCGLLATLCVAGSSQPVIADAGPYPAYRPEYQIRVHTPPSEPQAYGSVVIGLYEVSGHFSEWVDGIVLQRDGELELVETLWLSAQSDLVLLKLRTSGSGALVHHLLVLREDESLRRIGVSDIVIRAGMEGKEQTKKSNENSIIIQ